MESLGSKESVVRGYCDALATPRPLAAIADIAWSIGGELEGLIERSAPVHHLARALLDELGCHGVIVIEDVHWADAATLDVVRIACRRLEQATGLMIVTYRDDQIGRVDPVRVLLGELSSVSAVSWIHVDPLSVSAVVTLAAGSDIDPEELYRRTKGNAFFVTEVSGAGGWVVREAMLPVCLDSRC